MTEAKPAPADDSELAARIRAALDYDPGVNLRATPTPREDPFVVAIRVLGDAIAGQERETLRWQDEADRWRNFANANSERLAMVRSVLDNPPDTSDQKSAV